MVESKTNSSFRGAETTSWISPKKTEDLYRTGESKKPKRKKARSITINNALLKVINETTPRSKRSALIDKILSDFFGITYEMAYPEMYAKSYGEERFWDIEGKFRQMDIKSPGRFLVSKKRKRGMIEFYKSQMIKNK
jgi:hypothetical protein